MCSNARFDPPGGRMPVAKLGRVDEAADAYLAGIDAAFANGHTGLADDFEQAMEAL